MSHTPGPTPKDSATSSQELDHQTTPPARNTNTRSRSQPGHRSTWQHPSQRTRPSVRVPNPKPRDSTTWLRPQPAPGSRSWPPGSCHLGLASTAQLPVPSPPRPDLHSPRVSPAHGLGTNQRLGHLGSTMPRGARVRSPALPLPT